jgi:hypothetical protein
LDSRERACLHLADWLRRHGRIVRYLGLSNLALSVIRNFTIMINGYSEMQLWMDAMAAAAASLASAGVPPAAAHLYEPAALDMPGQHREVAATDTTDATASALRTAGAALPNSWKMQTLECLPLSYAMRVVPLPALLLQHLPAAALMQLVCGISFDQPEHLAALWGLTALRSLELLPQLSDGAGPARLMDCSRSVLSPMSALQQLTALKLQRV